MDPVLRRKRWLGAALFAVGLGCIAAGVRSEPSAAPRRAPRAPTAPSSAGAYAGAPPPLAPGYVVDAAGALAPEDRASLSNALVAVEGATGGGQMAVAIFTTLSGTPPEEAALAIARAWALGRAGADDGALLLLATEDRTVRLEVGRGWEGPLPDARAGDIVRAMTPLLRAGDWAEAARLCVREVQAAVSGRPRPAPRRSGSGSGLVPLGMVLVFAGLVVFVSGLEGSGTAAPPSAPMRVPAHRAARPGAARPPMHGGGGFRGGRGGRFGGGGAGGRF